MPRDIFPARHIDDDSNPILTASPEMKSPGSSTGQLNEDKSVERTSSQDSNENDDIGDNEDHQPGSLAYTLFRDHRDDMEIELSQKFKGSSDLHPYVQVLSISDLDACMAVETAAFPPDQAASREKVWARFHTISCFYNSADGVCRSFKSLIEHQLIYRLTVCPYICLGIFTHTTAAPTTQTQALYDAARAPDSANPNHKSLLIGHVLATLTTSSTVTEESMQVPTSFPSHPDFNPHAASSTPVPVLEREPSTSLPDSAFPRTNQSSDTPGHHPLGRTIAIHSVAMHPAFQNLGLGKTMLKAYLQRMEGSGIAERAALLAKDKFVGFYIAAFGFEDAGASQIKYGGGEWRNLVSTLFA